MKIVIAGAGEVGTYLARMLYKTNHDVIVVDNETEKLKYIDSHFDLMTINGSATSVETLDEAKINSTDLFISVVSNEDLNILACIIAKRLGAKKCIARVNSGEYLQDKVKKHFTDLGIDSFVYPEILASQEIVGLLKQTDAIKTYSFDNCKLALFAFKISPKSNIINKTLEEVAHIHNLINYRTVAITRQNKTLIPKGDDIFKENDLIYILTSHKNINEFVGYTGNKNVNVKNLMILGGSRIGIKTALNLEKKINVKLLEKNKQKTEYIAGILEDTLVINAEAKDVDTLKEEGVENMDAFLAVTGSASTNILACMMARKIGVKKTIAEIENIDYIELANNIGIDTIINKKLIAASHIFTFTMKAEVKSIQCLMNSEAEIIEFIAHNNSLITKNFIKNINLPPQVIIGAVTRGNDSFIAKGDTKIEANDRVVVFALPEVIDKVAKFFK